MMISQPLYVIVSSSSFKKSFKKYKHKEKVAARLSKCVTIFEEWKQLPASYRNHKLLWAYKGFSEFHLFPDVLVLYEVDHEKRIVTFLKIGSHSDLFW